jgi:hypothetical protein
MFYLGLKRIKCLIKSKTYTELLGKTNRIVEGTIIRDMYQADFRKRRRVETFLC